MTELKKGDGKNSDVFSNKHLFILEDSVFETISKRAWTDVLLQVYKVNCRHICYLYSEELMTKKCFEKLFCLLKLFFETDLLKLNISQIFYSSVTAYLVLV